jgi:hypothetical protein
LRNLKVEIGVRRAECGRGQEEGWTLKCRAGGNTRQLITRIYYTEASDVVGQLKEAAASVLAGIDALEACFDADDALRAQGVYGSGGKGKDEGWGMKDEVIGGRSDKGGRRSRIPKKVALIPRGLQQFIKIFCCQTAWSPRAYNVNFLRNILSLNGLSPTLFSYLSFPIYGGAVIFAPSAALWTAKARRREEGRRAIADCALLASGLADVGAIKLAVAGPFGGVQPGHVAASAGQVACRQVAPDEEVRRALRQVLQAVKVLFGAGLLRREIHVKLRPTKGLPIFAD